MIYKCTTIMLFCTQNIWQKVWHKNGKCHTNQSLINMYLSLYIDHIHQILTQLKLPLALLRSGFRVINIFVKSIKNDALRWHYTRYSNVSIWLCYSAIRMQDSKYGCYKLQINCILKFLQKLKIVLIFMTLLKHKIISLPIYVPTNLYI